MEINLPANTVSVYAFSLCQSSSFIYIVHGLIHSISLGQNTDIIVIVDTYIFSELVKPQQWDHTQYVIQTHVCFHM